MTQPRRDARHARRMNLSDQHARPHMSAQPNQCGLAQRDSVPIADSRPSSTFDQHRWDSWQSRQQDSALMTEMPGSPTIDEGVNNYWPWTTLITLTLCSMLGLAAVAIADSLSRQGYAYRTTSVFFWLGLLLIFVPIAGRVFMRATTRGERVTLIILLGIALYFVKILASPNGFTLFDEYIHWRNTEDILRTRHLFSFNPILPTAAYYPGLAAITASLVNLTGLSAFISGLIVIGVARVLISACFFLIAEMVTGSSRAAAGASLIYATNPMFLFWSSSFAYEDLALPLAAFIIWWLGRTRNHSGHLVPIVTTTSIVAVAITHHFVSLAVAALLGLWWLVERFTQRSVVRQQRLGLMVLISASAALIWFCFVARSTASYLFTNNILPALQQTGSLILRHSASRHLYASGGYISPKWETLAGFAAVGLLVLALPPALYVAWRIMFREGRTARAWRLRSRAPIAISVAAAVAYPLSLIPRLTPDGVAISGRSSEYVFTGLGCVLGLLAEESAWYRHSESSHQIRKKFLVGWRRTLAATCVMTLVFVGNITIGTAFYERLPESSSPQGYPWTVQPDVINASIWAREHLGINQRFGANAQDALALATYGEQNTVAENSVWPIFFASTMNEEVVDSIKSGKVHYVLVDWRMTAGVPPSPGYYFSPQEPDARNYDQPFPRAALRKFSSRCTRLIYHSGDIEIFDMSRIENGSCVPEASQNSKGGSPSS